MFKCKICIQKDVYIADLKSQIAYFKQILNPPARITKYEFQEDVIMNGGGQELEDPAVLEAAQIEADKVRREQDLIFTGNDIEVEEEVG